jgi:hypothetical protein
LTNETDAKVLAEAPKAVAVAPGPVVVVVTPLELVALAYCHTVALLLWLMVILTDWVIAPPATAAISASVKRLISVMVWPGSPAK